MGRDEEAEDNEEMAAKSRAIEQDQRNKHHPPTNQPTSQPTRQPQADMMKYKV